MPRRGSRVARETGEAASTKSKAARGAQAPGQFYGYSLQITRALAHLLRARPSQSVSVEVFDDVATSRQTGQVLEQDKSGLAHNPVSDRSIDLWKTLHNWGERYSRWCPEHDAKFRYLRLLNPMVVTLFDASVQRQI